MADRSHEHMSESFVQGAVKPQFGEVRIRNRGRLPHWEKEEGLYFITFHLADSLPRQALDEMVERNRILAAAKRLGTRLTPAQEEFTAKYSQKRIEEYFDRGTGECLLKDPRIAEATAKHCASGMGSVTGWSPGALCRTTFTSSAVSCRAKICQMF